MEHEGIVHTETSGDVHQLRLRVAKMERDFQSFESIQDAIELITPEEQYESRLSERMEFEDVYYANVAKAHKFLETIDQQQPLAVTFNQNTAKDIQSPVTVESDLQIKLPTMHLPKFSGSYTEWPGFADSFRSAVHDNTNFRETQKLSYLRSCLTGKAAEKIESLETTTANYAVAWNLLDNYYNDPIIVINNRIQAFFELPTYIRSNTASLGELVDQASKHYRALQALNKPFLEAFPIYAVTSKLDEATRMKWKERIQGKTDMPSMEELLQFLQARQKMLETNEKSAKPAFSDQPRPIVKTYNNTRPHQRSNVAYTAVQPSCALCKEKHYTASCSRLLHTEVNQRLGLIKQAGLCINCLRPNHAVRECRAGSCKQCNGKHHTLLHKGPNSEKQVETRENVSALTASVGFEMLLSTAVVNLVDRQGRSLPCRVLLDSGSQSHFLTERIAGQLGLPRDRINLPVIGINKSTTSIRYAVKTHLQSRINKFNVAANFLIIPHITNSLPTHTIARSELAIPKNIQLADPNFNVSSEIDGLIGADLFLQLLCVGQIQLANKAITLQKTKLGWVIAGRIPTSRTPKSTQCNLVTESVQDHLEKFWQLEESANENIRSKEETDSERHYQENTIRDLATGRYIVKFPFNDKIHQLGQSYFIALKRFRSLEQRLNKNPELRVKYTQFLDEYLKLGHMAETRTQTIEDGYYLPHHPILKQSSLTTKLRVVFDASAKTSKGISLNDTMLIGPTIQDDIFSIIARFRSHSYVLMADIEKTYRQVFIHPDERKYQKILWRSNPREPIKTYTLNTITYGTSSAPYLAIRSLFQLANDEEHRFPSAARTLREDFYVDDVITGANTYAEAAIIRDDLIQLCKQGGFDLRQWASNDVRLIEGLDSNTDTTHVLLDLEQTIKTLGIHWDARRDEITYSVNEFSQRDRVTKRTMLSQIASLFDPLGLIAPVIIRAKVLMQDLWKLQLNWDESVPANIFTTWCTFCNELKQLKNVRIPRQVTLKNHGEMQLHGFCDASEQAYGACIYIRTIDKENNVKTQLLTAKTRVAPVKTVTLPRLELCAAHVLAKLLRTTIRAMRRISFERIFLWSDSTVTLHWIKTSPHKLKTFVAHRVTDIQDVTGNYEWRHIASADNPADLLSRGLSTKELIDSAFWFHGPSWLNYKEDKWPVSRLEPIAIPEVRPSIVLTTRTLESDILERFSSFSNLKRVLAYILRFRHNSSRKESNKGTLSTLELHRAEQLIVQLIQRQEYLSEFHALEKTKSVTGNLAPLNPFIDSDGILRVGGRLSRSELPYNARHPILLPKGHFVTKLIITDYHIRNFHAGIQGTLNSLRHRFWIPNGKGASRELKEVYAFFKSETTNDTISTTLANEGINWHFIPPRSPHFGGLWEAAVRRTKHHLIEAILNSRPITPLSTDPNDLQPLTPGHFIVGELLTSVPDYSFTETPVGRLSSWQHIQQMRQHFWKRWSKDYLQEQTTRKKWFKQGAPGIAVGALFKAGGMFGLEQTEHSESALSGLQNISPDKSINPWIIKIAKQVNKNILCMDTSSCGN
ncbi:uncharacterized protein LOC143214214 [Lasioglossum baleicum]|uniref:uncharacterized protein LOC143214214 n=1 Tax=Lasioglossum baleicum TaxID=434251 RepID=UPI003FCD6D45